MILLKNDHVITLRDGRKLGFTEYGNVKGKPLLYFHGWPSGRLMARETDAAAKSIGVRVISIDRPGYGLSDYKENRTLLDWADDIIELVNQLKIEKFAVMGVSGGGPYAAVCAYKIPQRLTNVGIVVGLAPTYIPGILEGMALSNKLSWAHYHRFNLLRNLAGWFAYVRNRYVPVFNTLAFGAKQDKQMMDTDFKKRVQDSCNESFRSGIKGVAWDLYLYTHDWGFDLKDIKAPVYLWYGAEDKNVGIVMGKYYASQILNSKLTIYPDEGHFCRINHEEEIIKTLVNYHYA